MNIFPLNSRNERFILNSVSYKPIIGVAIYIGNINTKMEIENSRNITFSSTHSLKLLLSRMLIYQDISLFILLIIFNVRLYSEKLYELCQSSDIYTSYIQKCLVHRRIHDHCKPFP